MGTCGASLRVQGGQERQGGGQGPTSRKGAAAKPGVKYSYHSLPQSTPGKEAREWGDTEGSQPAQQLTGESESFMKAQSLSALLDSWGKAPLLSLLTSPTSLTVFYNLSH